MSKSFDIDNRTNRAAHLERNEYWWEHHCELEFGFTEKFPEVPWNITIPTIPAIVAAIITVWWMYG